MLAASDARARRARSTCFFMFIRSRLRETAFPSSLSDLNVKSVISL